MGILKRLPRWLRTIGSADPCQACRRANVREPLVRPDAGLFQVGLS